MSTKKKENKQNQIVFFFVVVEQAYSVRDEEVGYCQGLSFVIATLLIHV